jgi:4-amino-4-deoxy-L-arabinose transferase-like glycosyltransferase
MFWQSWSDYKRAQVVNGLIVAFFLVCAWRTSAANDRVWTLIFLGAAAVNIVGGLWRYRQKRCGVYDVERPNGPAS